MIDARMGHKMTHIDGQPAVVGGYESSLKDEIELFNGVEWVQHPDKLTYPRWAYGMPSYVPMSVITC